jgi:leader peptidase (prepilin peptidase)/N-methyltransferase
MTFARRSTGTDWTLALVSSLLDATIATWFVAVGASIGSFLNVVAYRLPLGRKLGGHSKCPYCCCTIRASDNIPVLAWVKLRGRCRCCRLPISVQYPLVEVGVALAFFLIFVSEFLTTGGNLPGVRGNSIGVSGLTRIADPRLLGLRLFVYVWALSGLIGAALIAVREKAVPFRLFGWSILPMVLAAVVDPEVIVVDWRNVPPLGWIEDRLDALTTLLCGSVAGLAVARVLSPILYQGFDRSLMSCDASTRGARQFCGAMCVAGCVVGWQSVIPLAMVILLIGSLLAWLLKSWRCQAYLADATIWVWLGLLIFRSLWKPIDNISLLPSSFPEIVRQMLGLALLAATAALFRAVSGGPTSSFPQQSSREDEAEAADPEVRSKADDVNT